MTIDLALPRYVRPRRLEGGATAFYWEPPSRDKQAAKAAGRTFPFEGVKLGEDLSTAELARRAAPYNAGLDGWRAERGQAAREALGAYGTVKWLVEMYQRSGPFLEKVSERSRADYRNLFRRVCDMETKRGRTVGDLPVRSIDVRSADLIYARIVAGGALRQGEKAVEYCRKGWRLMGRYHPEVMARDPESRAVLNPWVGVTLKRRTRKVKRAVGRAEVYAFAGAALAAGRPEAAAAAVICFEWLQRPESVTGGHFGWADFDPPEHRGWVRIEHHKTGLVGWHPLVTDDPDAPPGSPPVRLYPEAEAVLARVPRRGLAIAAGPSGQLYSPTRFAGIVRRVADGAGLPGFTLDACRHGGMTELEEAGLTEGQGMALSMHKTARIYRNYAKRTQQRALGATLKRHAWRLAQG